MKVTYIERSPGHWRLRIEDGVGPEGRRLFKYETLHGTLDDVQRRRFAILHAHEEGTFAKPDKLLFGAFFTHWIETRRALNKITRTTTENYEKIFRYFLQPIAGKRVQRITAQDVQAIYTSMAKRGDLAEGTLAHAHRIITAAFHAARRANVIKVNVMEEVEAPRRPRIKPKALSEAEAVRLLTSLAGHWLEPIVGLALATGMRRGETLGLRWGDVDLDGGRIHVRGQLVQYHDKSIEWTPTKTEAGLRTISVAGEVVDMLRRLRIEAGKTRMAMGLGGKLFDEAYVFTGFDGERPVNPGSLGTTFRRHCDAQGFADFSFHGTRHTHITTLLARVGKAGAKAVSQRAGHADLSTTLEVYQTVFEDDDRALADLSSGLFKGRK